MSQTFHIGCRTCQKHLWIGQNHGIYYGEEDTMKKLAEFLHSHKQNTSLVDGDNPEHILLFGESEIFRDAWPEWEEIQK